MPMNLILKIVKDVIIYENSFANVFGFELYEVIENEPLLKK